MKWLSLGGAIQNALPFAMGGKLHYDTGWDESYPAVLKIGAAVNVLDPEYGLRTIGDHKLVALADMDYEIMRGDKVPPIFHLGLEWRPLSLIAVRMGIDQEMVGPSETTNNFTSGVGVYYGDFRFDYAYHQFTGAPGVDNHFFSLSYGITPPKIIKDKLISEPDRVITSDTKIVVKGLAVDCNIVAVKINGLEVKMSPRGDFSTTVSLKVGKNTINVQGYDSGGKLVDSDKLRILRLITYPDVNKAYWANEQISYVGTLGIIKGYPDGEFKPDGNITRAELATLLVRTKMDGDENVPAATSTIFRDVPLTHWAAKYVNLAATDKIVKGYPDGTFKPSNNITRAEGLTMIARFGGVKEYQYANQFVDVTVEHWAATTISGAYTEGMLVYLKDQPFEPNRKLTRAEAVEMLYRSRPIKVMISDLLNFDKGY